MPSVIDVLRGFAALAVHLVAGGAPVSSLVVLGMIGAVAVIAAAVAARVGAIGFTGSDEPTFSNDVELPVLLVQSNPDADGHTRSRAPGSAFSAVHPQRY